MNKRLIPYAFAGIMAVAAPAYAQEVYTKVDERVLEWRLWILEQVQSGDLEGLLEADIKFAQETLKKALQKPTKEEIEKANELIVRYILEKKQEGQERKFFGRAPGLIFRDESVSTEFTSVPSLQ